MTSIIAEITDTGDIVVTETGTIRTNKDFMTAWNWFDKHKIPSIVDKGKIDWNKLTGAISEEYNNKTIKMFVFQKFVEEYGEDVLK